jgi:hypothetical protein
MDVGVDDVARVQVGPVCSPEWIRQPPVCVCLSLSLSLSLSHSLSLSLCMHIRAYIYSHTHTRTHTRTHTHTHTHTHTPIGEVRDHDFHGVDPCPSPVSVGLCCFLIGLFCSFKSISRSLLTHVHTCVPWQVVKGVGTVA